jgi:hypothetical protein
MKYNHTGSNGTIAGVHRNTLPALSCPNPVSSRVLSNFIKEWNFPNPDWSTLPPNFPNCDIGGLKKEEKHLYGALKLAWTVTQPTGKNSFLKSTFQSGLIALITLITLIGLINFISSPSKALTKVKEISAATISAQFRQSQAQVQDILESTASALFKPAH